MNDKAGAQVVKSWLDDADTEIEMVELGMIRGNRLSVSHLYYAVEKVTKAVRLANGIPSTKEHRIASLIADLGADNPWKARLHALEWLSDYATTFRYPTDVGRRKEAPPRDVMEKTVAEVKALIAQARAEL